MFDTLSLKILTRKCFDNICSFELEMTRWSWKFKCKRISKIYKVTNNATSTLTLQTTFTLGITIYCKFCVTSPSNSLSNNLSAGRKCARAREHCSRVFFFHFDVKGRGSVFYFISTNFFVDLPLPSIEKS